ncbi:MAG TPA: amidohydrolase [Acidimicrobiia bacterium]|nr:amidohydrolase [Acidimicrobiia bacterium]
MRPLPVTGASALDGTSLAVRAVDGHLAAVGPDVTPDAGDEILDASGRALLPGLVNGHTHAAMTLFRGFAGDLPLMEWLEDHIWPAEAKLDADDVYWGTRLACLEMIRTGTIRFWDMYWQPGAVARAVTDAGLRATVGLPLIDGLDPARSATLRADALRFLDEVADAGPHVTPSLTPHSIYAVSTESLAWVAEQSATRDLAVHLHFLEIADEASGCVERTGKRPGAYLHELGLLTPRTVLAHAVWMDPPDLDLVASGGSTVVTNPVSNLKLAVGRIFDYAAVHERGIPVALGTDGASSNNSLDLSADLKLFSLLQKHAANDTTAVPAAEAWRVATGASAPYLGATPLTVGAPADFILVRLDAPELGPGHLLANLVYAASGHVVDTTVVAGRVLMRGGVVAESDEIRAKARERAARLGVL